MPDYSSTESYGDKLHVYQVPDYNQEEASRRTLMACVNCRAKKQKCGGNSGIVCARCAAGGKKCVYLPVGEVAARTPGYREPRHTRPRRSQRAGIPILAPTARRYHHIPPPSSASPLSPPFSPPLPSSLSHITSEMHEPIIFQEQHPEAPQHHSLRRHRVDHDGPMLFEPQPPSRSDDAAYPFHLNYPPSARSHPQLFPTRSRRVPLSFNATTMLPALDEGMYDQYGQHFSASGRSTPSIGSCYGYSSSSTAASPVSESSHEEAIWSQPADYTSYYPQGSWNPVKSSLHTMQSEEDPSYSYPFSQD